MVLKGRNRDSDIEIWTQQGKERVGQTESSTEIYTVPCLSYEGADKVLLRVTEARFIHL